MRLAVARRQWQLTKTPSLMVLCLRGHRYPLSLPARLIPATQLIERVQCPAQLRRSLALYLKKRSRRHRRCLHRQAGAAGGMLWQR
jgi:hypothetical protein